MPGRNKVFEFRFPDFIQGICGRLHLMHGLRWIPRLSRDRALVIAPVKVVWSRYQMMGSLKFVREGVERKWWLMCAYFNAGHEKWLFKVPWLFAGGSTGGIVVAVKRGITLVCV